jgi:hypothetical protein
MSDENWKPRVIMISTGAGALTGFLAGYLLSRTAEEQGTYAPKIATLDVVRVAIAAFGIVRAVAALGDRGN